MAPQFKAVGQPPHQPGIHAFIVGISQYENLPLPGSDPDEQQSRHGLGLKQLTCAASSAFRFYQWLHEQQHNLSLPLLSCRLLMSPLPEEIERVDGLGDIRTPATLANLLLAARAWRADAAVREQNVTVFYFAGHGFERKRGDQVLVLQDVGDGLGGRLAKAFEVSNLVHGMAPSEDYPLIARQQLYFYDACRLPLTEGSKWENENCSEIWSVPAVATDDRSAMEFVTAKPGVAAFAIRDEQTIFSRAVLDCLSGAGAVLNNGRWQVDVLSLNKSLGYQLRKIGREEEVGLQAHVFRGPGDPFVIVRLDSAPEADLTIYVTPYDSNQALQVTMDDFTRPKIVYGPPLEKHPLSIRELAGQYVVTTTRLGVPKSSLMSLDPPASSWPLSVAPVDD